jgi:hypothetical protein
MRLKATITLIDEGTRERKTLVRHGGGEELYVATSHKIRELLLRHPGKRIISTISKR